LGTEDFSGGQADANATLRKRGAKIVDLRRLSLEDELEWRLEQWADLAKRQADGIVIRPSNLTERRIYGGAAGVWGDQEQTGRVMAPGIAVAILHTGKHYDDDLGETSITYHYPVTARSPAADANEIEALRNAATLQLPIFVIANGKAGSKVVHLGWITKMSDELAKLTVVFDSTPAKDLEIDPAPDEGHPFEVHQVHKTVTRLVTHKAGR
jgi:hypothetical protein